MFSALRWRLTLLSLLVALALIGMVAAGTTWLLRDYFQTTTDLALRYRMASEFRALGLEPPATLREAEQTWQTSRAAPTPLPERRSDDDDEDEGEDHHGGRPRPATLPDERYDAELAPIAALRLDSSAGVVGFLAATPFAPSREGLAAALEQGADLRTVQQGSASLRVLTYRLPPGGNVAALQLARPLADQGRVLQQIALVLLALGGLCALLLALGSWWLAGRAIVPAQQAWERQQLFVANAGHELRTPLTLIRASAEVARRSTPTADTDQRELLDDVLLECDHMGRLVEDLLLLSRMDAGRLVLERRPVPLAGLLADVARQVERVAAERGVRLVAGPSGGNALADPTRLRQVLLILLDNALRYTPAGGTITLAVGQEPQTQNQEPRTKNRRDAESTEQQQLHLTNASQNSKLNTQHSTLTLVVADTGSGIAPEHLPHVFERFYQADSARGASNGGTGLGLAIARSLIEAQGGRIAIASAPGQGTRVTVELPRAVG
ncbi:MAG: ATP-binding protein [Roseiflexaceae bacterium]